MKILFDHQSPFLLAHGGFQIQIEQTAAALKAIGVEVEYLRWWDENQKGDIIHFFGRPFDTYVDTAHSKGMKIVFTALHGQLGVRAAWKRAVQKSVMRSAEKAVPSLVYRMSWRVYRDTDACITITPWERDIAREMFDAPAAKVHVVPNGVEEVFFKSGPVPRGKWLVTTASILPIKRVLETAEAAIRAEVPYWVIGKPMGENDEYYRRFRDFVRANPKWLRYEGAIGDRAQLAAVYREARGFVLLSDWETLSISALEAAACECPLLLKGLPWARTVFGDTAAFTPLKVSPTELAGCLKRFYEAAPSRPLPEKPMTWKQVAQQLKDIYESLPSISR